MPKELVRSYDTEVIGISDDRNIAMMSLLVARDEGQEIVPSQRIAAENAAKTVFEVLGVSVNSASGQLSIPEVDLGENERLSLEIEYKLYKVSDDE